MKMRRDPESGLLVPERERIWTPHRDRRNCIGAPFFSSGATTAQGTLRFLSHFEGIDNSAVVFDSSPYNWQATGGHPAALIKTTRAKFGTSSLASFRTLTNQGIRVGDNTKIFVGRQTPPPDAFSIDFWLYVVNTHPLDNGATVFNLRTSLGYLIYLTVVKQNPGPAFYTGFGGNWGSEGPGTRSVITANTWHHIAIASDGVNMWRYHDGVLALTMGAQVYGGINNSPGLDLMGYYPYGSNSPNNSPDGATEMYLDEMRILWGECPYNGSNFFPPVSPYGQDPDSWDPAITSGIWSFSDSQMTAEVVSGAGMRSVHSKLGKAAGKWYFEILNVSGGEFGTSVRDEFGLGSNKPASGGNSIAQSGAAYRRGGSLVRNGAELPGAVPVIPNGGVVGVAVDLTAGTASFFLNGTLVGTVGGMTAGLTYFIAVGSENGSGRKVNLRLTDTSFTYAPPSGYSAWGGTGT